ncbi:GNAT family N-acetyltransferase [Deinococcus lacus]|uniref:GNAT family N-acetyltransferase n=1 Tax=Deinococcus lacus TaxID=392561 RepID=A0ABW1YBG6_9DEIO
MIGDKALWSQGYGREAVLALLDWSFGGRLDRVRLMTYGHNVRAQRAFLACGFREVGRSQGTPYDEVYMEITRQEWLSRAGAEEN